MDLNTILLPYKDLKKTSKRLSLSSFFHHGCVHIFLDISLCVHEWWWIIAIVVVVVVVVGVVVVVVVVVARFCVHVFLYLSLFLSLVV